jgi:hypothetical protein
MNVKNAKMISIFTIITFYFISRFRFCRCTKSFKNQLNQDRICSKTIKIKMISISSIVNIVEKTNSLMIDVTNTRIVEMNFEMKIDQMINFELLDSRKFALYVKNSIADQAIIRKRSEMTRKSDFRIVTLVKNGSR